MQTDIEALNRTFGIEGSIRFRDIGNGFCVIDIHNEQCTASLALNGAHLLSWQPHGHDPVIWLSEAARFENGKSIRGGIPVCWPWFGAHGSEPSFPAHGFARTAIWGVSATHALPDGRTELKLRLETPASYLMWPFPTRCDMQLILGDTLEISLTTTNRSHEPIILGQALHTYFAVGDIREVAVHGLDRRDYLDKPDGFSLKQQHGPVTFTSEVDRIYLNTADDCLIEDPDLKRVIRIEKRGSQSTVVWNPWHERAAEMGDLGENGYLGMLCVESANAAQDVVSIQPEASHTLWVRYGVEGIGNK